MEKQVIIPLEEYNDLLVSSTKQYQDEETRKIMESLRVDYTKEKWFNDILKSENLSLRQENDKLAYMKRWRDMKIEGLRKSNRTLGYCVIFLSVFALVFVLLYILK